MALLCLMETMSIIQEWIKKVMYVYLKFPLLCDLKFACLSDGPGHRVMSVRRNCTPTPDVSYSIFLNLVIMKPYCSISDFSIQDVTSGLPCHTISSLEEITKCNKPKLITFYL